MKACIHKNYGPPANLELRDVKVPPLNSKELLVRVHTTTVNRTDCAMLRAKPFIMRFLTGLLRPKNPILGTDFAGVIDKVGKNVEGYTIGDRIFGFGDEGLSSHAQYLSISPDKAIARIPDRRSFEEAVASLEGAHYAINMYNKIKLNPGHRVLVNGATGAIGSAALQLGVYYGATVDAVCNGKNIDLIRSLGASQIFDYETEDFTQSGKKYDFILDTVGKSTFSRCKPILNKDGVYISSELGPGAQNIFYAVFTPLISKKKVIFPIPADKKQSVLLMTKLLEEEKFKPVIDRVYPFDEIVTAFEYVESGGKTGNVIISWI